MALTKLETKKFIDSTERGVTSQTQKPVKPGQKMPIYLPKLMPYITKGGTNSKTVVTSGNMIFINDVSCKPNAPSIIRTQNYISPKFDSNGSWSGIIEDVNKDDVPAGTNVQVTFPSGNLLDPTFSPN